MTLLPNDPVAAKRLMMTLTAIERALGQAPEPRPVDDYGTLRWTVIVGDRTYTIQPWSGRGIAVGYIRRGSHYAPVVDAMDWRNPAAAIARIVEFFLRMKAHYDSSVR